jgi:hypothetical protein
LNRTSSHNFVISIADSKIPQSNIAKRNIAQGQAVLLEEVVPALAFANRIRTSSLHDVPRGPQSGPWQRAQCSRVAK